MDKKKLKRKIKSFAANVGLAAAMSTLAIFYGATVVVGEGFVWMLVLDIILAIYDTIMAVLDWKEIKKLLGESE